MKRIIIVTVAFLMLCMLWLPFIGAAQDYDAMATAQAADAQANQARQEAARRAAIANAAAATAQAAYAVATNQAQATATAQVIQTQTTATAQAMQATAVSANATQAILNLQAAQTQATHQAAAWAFDATATAVVYQTQATSQALQIEREQASVSNAKAIGMLVKYAVWATLVLVCLFGVSISWRWLGFAFANRQTVNNTVQVDSDVVTDAEPQPISSTALIPPTTGWKPAYLRPKPNNRKPTDV